MLRLLALLLALIAAPASAQPLGAGRNNIAAELVAESSAPAPGQPVTVAFSFTPQPGWHGYWLNPGDAGAPARVHWQLPPGVEAGPLQFPVPGTLLISGLMNYVFEGPHALLTTLQVPAGATPGTRLPVRAKIDYLACTDRICVPERAELSLDLIVGDGGSSPQQGVQFASWRAALPRPIPSPGTYEITGDRLRLALPIPPVEAAGDAFFFPGASGIIQHAATQSISRAGEQLIVEVAIAEDPPPSGAIEGLLRVGDKGFSVTATPGAVPAAGQPVPVLQPRAAQTEGEAGEPADLAQPIAATGLLGALLGAVLGGLILNVMPCVFPILSLKALSLARAGESEWHARREALAYSAGVILTCLALGALLLALRAGGAAVGWAFQLQEPRFVLLLLLLVTAIALNLAGLFRLPGLSLERQGGGTASAFGTGALAAFVATPCTGPFMAAALGAALVLPAAAALLVFGGLGVGLALPFLLLGFVPALRRLLPRPGPWMVRLQRILSIPMFLTALGLAWVLGRQTGVDGMTLGIAAALLLGLGLWWLGARPSIRQRWAAATLLAAAILAPVALLRPADPARSTASARLDAEPFAEARLAQLRAEGRPVFLYFTADWCLTCKVNEGGALASRAVADSFAAGNIEVLEGDWTLGDEAIGRFLERHGRSGVPLYVFYPAGGEPRILPQILTSAMLTELAG